MTVIPRLAYSVTELAEAANVSPQTIYREIEAGALQAKRIRGRLVIPADAVTQWLTPDEDGAEK